MKNRILFNACFLIIFLCGFYLQNFAQPTPPDPPPPLAVSNATSHKYSTVEGQFDGTGDFLIRQWYHSFEASDAIYVIGQARLSITPPKGSALEDIDFQLPPPCVGCCRLESYLPKSDAPGITLSGALNLDATTGVNLGNEVGVLNESTYIVSAGQDGAERAVWIVDLPDGSITSTKRVSLDFVAEWRCDKGSEIKLQDITLTKLFFEIDSYGFDEVYSYYFNKFSEYQWWPWADEDFRDIEEIEINKSVSSVPNGIYVDPNQNHFVMPGSYFPVRARVYEDEETLEQLKASAALSTNGENVPMEVSKVQTNIPYPFVEMFAWIEVGSQQDVINPQITLSYPDGNNVNKAFPEIPVAQMLDLGASTMVEPETRKAYFIQGEKGEQFKLGFENGTRNQVDFYPNGLDRNKMSLSSVGGIREIGDRQPILFINSMESEAPLELNIERTNNQEGINKLFIVIGIAGILLGIIFCRIFRK